MSEQQTYWLMTWHTTENVRIHKRVTAGTYAIGSRKTNDVVLPAGEVVGKHAEVIIQDDGILFYRDLTMSNEKHRLHASQVYAFRGFFVLLMPVPAVPSPEMLNALNGETPQNAIRTDRQNAKVQTQTENSPQDSTSEKPVETVTSAQQGTQETAKPATTADETPAILLPDTTPETARARTVDPMFPLRGAGPSDDPADDKLPDDVAIQSPTPTTTIGIPMTTSPPADNKSPGHPIETTGIDDVVKGEISLPDEEQPGFDVPTKPYIDEDPIQPYELLPIDEPLEEESQYTLPKDWQTDNNALSVQIHRKTLRFVPGERVRIPVSVKNNNPTAGLKLRVSVHGLPLGWKVDSPPVFELASGEIKALRIILYETDGRANTEKHVQLYIEDVDVPNIRTHLDIPIKLKQDRDLSCRLILPVLSDAQTGYVEITNHTQTETPVAISADFDTTDALIFVHENTAEVAPHQTIRVPYTIDVHARHFFQQKPHLYWIAISPRTRTTLDLPGTAVIEPVLNRARVLMIGASVVIVLALIAVMWATG